jgi:cytoskeletal protein RodZ
MDFDPAGVGPGTALREARERRGLSLRQISDTTKISVAALESIERNDLSRLPGGLFSRAFVRAFAAQVGLDPEEAVRDFEGLTPEVGVGGRPGSGRPGPEQATGRTPRSRWAIAGVALFGMLIAALLVFFGIREKAAHLSNGERVHAAPGLLQTR